jgi:hypothetical protein
VQLDKLYPTSTVQYDNISENSTSSQFVDEHSEEHSEEADCDYIKDLQLPVSSILSPTTNGLVKSPSIDDFAYGLNLLANDSQQINHGIFDESENITNNIQASYINQSDDYIFGNDFVSHPDFSQNQLGPFDDFESPNFLPFPDYDNSKCNEQNTISSPVLNASSLKMDMSSDKKRKSKAPTDPSPVGSSINSHGLEFPEDEFRMTSKRRRRLSQIVPYPRKPRTVDYNCYVCNEMYSHVAEENPWWALYQHECPKCGSMQIPRLDISLSQNAIECDPNVTALYGEGVDDGEIEGFEGYTMYDSDDTVSVEEDVEGDNDPETVFPFDGDGLLSHTDASKLLILMTHARTCDGQHRAPAQAEVCRGIKYLMLHVRDCAAGACRFAWCVPCKKMLRHLTRCYNTNTCIVCSPWTIPDAFCQLSTINNNRAHAVATVNKKLIYASKLECRDDAIFRINSRKHSDLPGSFLVGTGTDPSSGSLDDV